MSVASDGQAERWFKVRDPALRLGAGSTGSNTDMEALRDHPFFASINWGTLWTDAVPPLESGLVKKEPLKGANGEGWDVGASWDALVGDSDPEDDISWASEGEGQDVFATQGAKAPNGYAYHEDVGPAGELRPYAFCQPTDTIPTMQHPRGRFRHHLTLGKTRSRQSVSQACPRQALRME